MLIVPYDDKYKDGVIQVINNFYTEALSEYSSPIDKDVLSKTIEQYKDNTFLLLIEGKCEGIFAGITTTSPLNSDKVYQELIWYVNKPHRLNGVYFLRQVELILEGQGYKQLVMAVMANSKMDKITKLYKRMNFKLFEMHFIKTL